MELTQLEKDIFTKILNKADGEDIDELINVDNGWDEYIARGWIMDAHDYGLQSMLEEKNHLQESGGLSTFEINFAVSILSRATNNNIEKIFNLILTKESIPPLVDCHDIIRKILKQRGWTLTDSIRPPEPQPKAYHIIESAPMTSYREYKVYATSEEEAMELYHKGKATNVNSWKDVDSKDIRVEEVYEKDEVSNNNTK